MIHAYEKRTNFADMNHVHYRKILNADSNLSAAIKKKKKAPYIQIMFHQNTRYFCKLIKRSLYLRHILITDIIKWVMEAGREMEFPGK